MIDYKFLHSIHMDSILIDGTIRISTLSHYRKLEKTQWIADRLEGTMNVHFDEDFVNQGDEAAAFTPEGLHPPMKAETGGRIVIRSGADLSFQHPDVFIFCASRGDLASLTPVMCKDPLDNPYDACVRIADMPLLAHRMFYSGIVLELGNSKVSKLFAGFICQGVAYDNLLRDQRTMTARPPQPSPFLKHHDPFSQQREVRIAFQQPLQAISLETLTIKIPRPREIFIEEFRGISGAISSGSGAS